MERQLERLAHRQVTCAMESMSGWQRRVEPVSCQMPHQNRRFDASLPASAARPLGKACRAQKVQETRLVMRRKIHAFHRCMPLLLSTDAA